MKQFGIISLFPEMFTALDYGITGRAKQLNLVSTNIWNPRDYTHDKHRRVDDRPYGGGPGMVMMVQPLRDTILAAKQSLGADTPVIYLSPQGRRLDQAGVFELAKHPRLILLAGRYEGIDERLFELGIDQEWSIGDYVLSGGEFPAMVLMDALIRLIPGALGDAESAPQDSFYSGLLDTPHYTRPENIDSLSVPNVLLSGNSKLIDQWRLKNALGRTWLKRPDLLDGRSLSTEEQRLLTEFIDEVQRSRS
jgi:tRNA (guanine37-N1)-methyltransferase